MQKFIATSSIFLIVTLLFLGCGKDNPVAPQEPEHLGAEGCVIKQGDVEVVRAEKGKVTGGLVVEERVQSPALGFYLIAKDGKLFNPESEEYLFSWTSKKPDIADAVQYETGGAWNFHVKGFDVGQTSIVFKVLHGDHDDFVSLDIPIQVTPGSGGGLGK